MSLLVNLTRLFPQLATTEFRRTSLPSIDYNCIAWAAGDINRRWDVVLPNDYWPAGVEKKWNEKTIMAAYRKIGYRKCGNGDLEPEVDKIAIYIKDGKPTHAARQLDDGQWTSKLGDLDDINHTLDGLVGDRYGQPMIFMKRKRRKST